MNSAYRSTRVFFAILTSFSLLLGTAAAGPREKKNEKRAGVAAAPATPRFTLEGLARNPGSWMGTAPVNIRWTLDGAKLHFQWNPEMKDLLTPVDWYELDVRTAGSKPRRLADDELRWLTSNPGDVSRDHQRKTYVYAGDVYFHDARSEKTKQITYTADNESNASFSFDEKGVIYTRGDNLYEWNIETGETRQWTDFRRGRDPEDKPKLSKQDEYLEKQQLELFEVLSKQEEQEKENKERTKARRGPFPKTTYLKENEAVTLLQLSPDRKYVTFEFDDRTEAARSKVTEMPRYVTKSGYTEMQRLATDVGGQGRTKVGANLQTEKLGVMNTADGTIRYADPGLEKRAYGVSSPVIWSWDGKNAITVLRANDNKDRWVYLFDVASAKLRLLDTEHDAAWIQIHGPYGWLDDNQTIWFRSERDGYLHVYSLSITEGSKPRQLTSGKWEVTGVQLSDDRSQFFLTTSEPHPAERQIYSMPASGGARTRLSEGVGVYAATLSPDDKWMAVTFGSPNAGTDLYLQEVRAGAKMSRLVDSYSAEFKALPWSKFEVVTFPDQHGHMLYARYYKPEKPHPLRPAVIYVHGAGYAQSVFQNWGTYNSTPFFNLLLQEGYAVMDLDYRGSSGYGRDCRTDIYRNAGGKDIDSGVAAAKWLAAQGVDPRRIGIWGGSYGGFYTLMAQFKHPGVFAAGGALFPVTDWAHYNQPYTANIFNSPAEDDEAYRRSSPIYYAQNFSDRLLIVAGIHDNNVHYQDTVRLQQKLIELKKPGWEVAALPVEGHGYTSLSAAAARYDVHRRMYELFESVLKRPLPALPKTAGGAKKAAAEKAEKERSTGSGN